MLLSKRTQDFLGKSNRDTLPTTEQDIRNAFIANNAPIFESLIHFQLKFGGYIFKAGLEPIKFNLLKGEGGYPKSGGTSIVEFEESGLTAPRYYFDCAMTNYPMQFFLDEHGVYYEDYEAKASTFAKVVEHLALWDKMLDKVNYEVLYRDKLLSTDSV